MVEYSGRGTAYSYTSYATVNKMIRVHEYQTVHNLQSLLNNQRQFYNLQDGLC